MFLDWKKTVSTVWSSNSAVSQPLAPVVCDLIASLLQATEVSSFLQAPLSGSFASECQ